MHGYFGEGFHMMGFGWILITIIIATIVWLLVKENKNTSKTPQDILDERYAAGDIDLKEYQERSQHLKNKENN